MKSSASLLQYWMKFPRRYMSSLGPKSKNALALMRWYKENNLLYGPILEKEQQKIFLKKRAAENNTFKPNLSLNSTTLFDSNSFHQKPERDTNVDLKSLGYGDPSFKISNTNTTQGRPKFSAMKPNVNVFTTNEPKPPSVGTDNQKPVKELSAEILSKLNLIKSAPLMPGEVTNEYTDLSEMLVYSSVVTMPSVSRILSTTRTPENEMFLERWKQKMIVELGEEGFKKYQEDMLRRGINFHGCIQSFLSGTDIADIQLQEENRGHWDSIQSILGNVTDVQGLETRVAHPYLQYAGTFDCLATYTNKDTVCLIDWKTSQKPKPHLSYTYDHPLQAAAYIGALNHDTNQSQKVSSALIVIAYGDGANAHAHFMDEKLCQKYWSQWLSRLHLYWRQVLSK